MKEELLSEISGLEIATIKQSFSWVLRFAEEYAKLKCKEQREICASNARANAIFSNNSKMGVKEGLDAWVDKNSVIYCDEPKFD